jgi:ABC-type polysaccharide/polyol phosphate transport system ATPase subunit
MPAAVSFKGVSKRFRIYHQRHENLKEVVLRRRRGVYEEFYALRDVSFDVQPASTVGIIGSNGSGKTTSLKLIARILHPNAGQVSVHGRVSALLELGTGFHPDYTGRENIFLNGALLGLRRDLIRRRLDDIIGFAGMERFIDNPVKTYSSGMYMRLGFAIAVNVDPDVLLVDEVLAVGDADFAQKCYDRINRFRSEGKTIVFVSHDLSAVRRFCDRAIWIDRGIINADGNPNEVTAQYLADAERRTQTARDAADEAAGPDAPAARISRLELLGGDGQPQYVFEPADALRVRISYHCNRPIDQPVFGMWIVRNDGVNCFGSNTRTAGPQLPRLEGSGSVTITVPHLNLLEGGYLLSVMIGDELATYDLWEHRLEFRVRQNDADPTGLVFMPARWTID